jgi:hypothetical protein
MLNCNSGILALSNPYIALLQRFFCWGHCVAGPNWKSAFGSALLIVAPTVVFLYFVAPYVAREVHAVLLVIR